METRTIRIASKKNRKVTIKIIPGHFATNHSHINYYIDMTGIKYRNIMGHDAALAMAEQYLNATPIDTIVCMDGCQTIGAYLAYELTKSGMHSMNTNNDIYIVDPEYNTNGQLIFRDNVQPKIWNKNVLLLIASATTGKSINRSMECINYYGGRLVGISAIFSAIDEMNGIPIKALFTTEDIPDYQSYKFTDCPHCKNQEKIDAIVNSFGYSKL